MLLVQGLVLVFTAALWWIARRDLALRIPPPVPNVPPADTAELEQLCTTLATLVTSLSQRLEVVEARLPKPKAVTVKPVEFAVPEPPVAAEPLFETPVASAIVASAVAPEPPPETRYAPVYALLASGLFDPVEIARRTGLGRGEVDLILSLRDRQVL